MYCLAEDFREGHKEGRWRGLNSKRRGQRKVVLPGMVAGGGRGVGGYDVHPDSSMNSSVSSQVGILLGIRHERTMTLYRSRNYIKISSSVVKIALNANRHKGKHIKRMMSISHSHWTHEDPTVSRGEPFHKRSYSNIANRTTSLSFFLITAFFFLSFSFSIRLSSSRGRAVGASLWLGRQRAHRKTPKRRLGNCRRQDEGKHLWGNVKVRRLKKKRGGRDEKDLEEDSEQQEEQIQKKRTFSKGERAFVFVDGLHGAKCASVEFTCCLRRLRL